MGERKKYWLRSIWQKMLFVLCLCCLSLAPLAQAAEGPSQQAEDAWALLARASELSKSQLQYGMRCSYRTEVQGAAGIGLSVKGDATVQSNVQVGSYTEGLATVELQLPGMQRSFTLPLNSYSLMKGNNITVYTQLPDGSWQLDKYKNPTDLIQKMKADLEKAPALLAQYADASIAGEKDGLVDIKLVPRADAVMPDLSGLTDNKELLELQQSMSKYFLAATPENLELHVGISKATGELVSWQLDMSRWLKEELQMLAGRPEIQAALGLPEMDLSGLQCVMTMSSELIPVPKDFKVVVPAGVKKNAKKAEKK